MNKLINALLPIVWIIVGLVIFVGSLIVGDSGWRLEGSAWLVAGLIYMRLNDIADKLGA